MSGMVQNTIWYGDFMCKPLLGIRLIRKVAWEHAWYQKWIGSCASDIKLIVVSTTCLFFFSVTPFCWGEWGHETWCIIRFASKNSLNKLHVFSYPPSDCKILIDIWNWFKTKAWKLVKFEKASDLFTIGNIHTNVEQSSTKVM